MNHLQSVELALWKDTDSLPKYLNLLLHPHSLSQLLIETNYVMAALAKFIAQNAGILKICRAAKFSMAIVLTGHVHLLEPFNKKVWPEIVKLCAGYHKQKRKEIMEDQIYQWNRIWAREFVFLLSTWLPLDIYDDKKQSVYSVSYKKYGVKVHKIQFFTTERLQHIEMDYEFYKLISKDACQYCSNRKYNRMKFGAKIDPEDLIFTRPNTPTIQPSPSQHSLIQSHQNVASESKKRILKFQKAYQFKIMSQDKKKFSLASRSLDLKNKIERKKFRKSVPKQSLAARKQPHEKQTESSSNNTPSIQLSKSQKLMPMQSILQNDCHEYFGEYLSPKKTHNHSKNFLKVPKFSKSNFSSNTLLSDYNEYPHSMFEQSNLNTSIFQQSSNFKKQLATKTRGSIMVGEDIQLDVRVFEGIVTLWYNRPQIKSFKIIQPLKLVVKQNKNKGLVVFDFTSGPQILKVKINQQQVTLPIGFLRLLEPIQDLKEWEIQKSILRKRVFLSNKKASKCSDQIAKLIGLTKKKTNTSLIGKFEGTFRICKQIIKLSVQSLGNNKISLQGWGKKCPQSVQLIQNILSQIIFCFS